MPSAKEYQADDDAKDSMKSFSSQGKKRLESDSKPTSTTSHSDDDELERDEERDRSSSSTENESSEEETQDEPMSLADIRARLGSSNGRHRRSVVSSPVTMDKSWKPPVYAKTEQDEKSIRASVQRNILFADISEETLEILVKGMKYLSVKPSEVIIRQGDPGDLFYILDSGTVEVLVNDRVFGEIEGTSKRNFFGELALLYDAPRAATIVAKTPVECWALDRITFKRVLMSTTIKQRQLYLDFIDQVPIFSAIGGYDRMIIADALRPLYFEEGDVILERDAQGDDLYIIEDGEVKCTIDGREVSSRLGCGDFFGELALLSDLKRRATVTAVRKTKCVVLDCQTFTRLLGPMRDHLKKRADLYELYMKNVVKASA